MIFRHLFKTTRLPQSNWTTYRPHRLFSSIDDEKTPNDNNEQEIVAQEIAQDAAQMLQVSDISEEIVSEEPTREKKFARRNRKSDEDESLRVPFVHSFLAMKKPEIDLSNLPDQNIDEKIIQLAKKHQQNLYAPLSAYQRRLNLSVENISRIRTTQPQDTEETLLKYAKIGAFEDNPIKLTKWLISSNRISELKNIYESQFFRHSFSAQFCQLITNHVLTNPKDAFLLNIIYQNTQAYNFSNKFPITIPRLSQLVQMIRCGQITSPNPLKFYWFTIMTNPTLRSELSLNILREVNKLYFNGVNMESKLSETSLFIVRQKLCCKIINEIISVCKSLEQFLGIWASTMVVMNRLHMIVQEHRDLPEKLNFNDIILNKNMSKKEGLTYSEFFNHNLPKMLYHHSDPQIFQVYQRALKFSQTNPKDSLNYVYNGSGFNVDFTNNLTIQYRNNGDKFAVVCEYKVRSEKKDIWVRDSRLAETKVASAIAQGEYKKALDYYFATMVSSEDQKIQLNRLLNKAKQQGFESQHNEALYVFRELARKLNYQFDPMVSLTPELLNKAIFRNFGDRRRDNRPPVPQNSEQQSFVVSKQNRIENREKKGFFGKPTSSAFSSQKETDQKRHYEEYLKIAKETEEAAIQPETTILPSSIFDFKKCSNFRDVSQEFQKNIDKISQQNLSQVISAYKNIPIVDSVQVLLKFYFLKKNNDQQRNPGGLVISFNSSLGPIEKDYGEYLTGSFFPYALTDKLYSQMLFDQTKKFNRKQFKKICAHLLCYKNELSHQIIRQMCDICSKQKIGITLLEIMHLINMKRINISYESLKTISAGVQKYRNMESDLVQFLKGYSENTGTPLETALFEQYIANLTFSEQYEKLNEFLETLKFELRVREYKINQKLSPDENIEAQAKHKKQELARYNHQNFMMLEIISQNFRPRTQVPNFIPDMYQVYLGQKGGEFDSKDIGIGLLLNGRNQDEFLNVLIRIKENPHLNDDYVLRSGIRVLSIFSRKLKPHIEKVLNLTIYNRKAQLTKENLVTLGQVFRDVDLPNVFSEFLEYLLILKIDITPEIKNQYYKIFNAITDDYSKNQISGLLDFIFNPKREKEREEFRAIKEEQEKKSKLLKQLSKAQAEKTKKTQQTGSPTKEGDKQDKISKKEKKKMKKQKKTEPQTVSANKKMGLQDSRLTYTPKHSSYHLRNRPLRIFLGTFMKKYEPIVEGEDVDIEKGKQGVKGVKIKGDKKRKN